MATKIFVNLPVKNLDRTVQFFTRLGFKFNPQFTDENATCMIVGEDIFVMLLVEKFFKTFTPKEISDTHTSTEVIVALSADSREEVDKLVDTALSAGAKTTREPEVHDGMYGRAFEDLDGHLWEVGYIDLEAMSQG